jgi:hypothetical protein
MVFVGRWPGFGIGLGTAAGGIARRAHGAINRLLQQYVDKEQIAGAVALVLRDGRPGFMRRP